MKQSASLHRHRNPLLVALISMGVVALAFVYGCSDYETTQLLTPSASIQEGVRVAGALSPSIEIANADGSTQTTLLPSQSYSTRFFDGAAILSVDPHPATLGARLPGMVRIVAAATASSGPNQKSATFTDSAGHVHRLVINRDGNRILSTRQTIDGVPFAEINNRWKRQGDTWILQKTEVVAHENGKTVRLSVNAAPRTVAYLSDVGHAKSLMVTTASATLSLFTPAVAYASCVGATLELVGASGLLAVELMSPPPIDVIALAATMSLYAAAVDNYGEECGPEPT